MWLVACTTTSSLTSPPDPRIRRRLAASTAVDQGGRCSPWGVRGRLAHQHCITLGTWYKLNPQLFYIETFQTVTVLVRMAVEEGLRVLELFSGIGGMHRALELAQVKDTGEESIPETVVVAAVDINTVSNEVYAHNHPGTRLLNRNIGGLTLKELTKLGVQVGLAQLLLCHTHGGGHRGQSR